MAIRRDKMLRHAGSGDLLNGRLCGEPSGRVTDPTETIDCVVCQAILVHLRKRYPEHAEYADWRLTTDQEAQSAAAMVADMHGGSND